MVLVVRDNQLARARLGIVATRKLGPAVLRNRAKRLAREVFRRCKRAKVVLGRDIIVIPKRELPSAPLAALEDDFRHALRREGQIHRATSGRY